MQSAQIRETFLAFFEQSGHRRVKSSSLIPAADPTLLFTNAGMVPFKDFFLGVQKPEGPRATSSQKCVRAGGKHNDLENVGFTPRHHTFFEMLGNFSFGDYFKPDAIAFAWELLTKRFLLPKDRLRITIHHTDDEAFELWKKQGVNPAWIERLGDKDNFWAMGDTGPCGPCTEIHYDWGEKYGDGTPGTNTAGRFLEIWNLVFMQFNRDPQGNVAPLPKPSVDTGAGLERLSCVMQGVFSNYDTDVFKPLLQSIADKTGHKYGVDDGESTAMRVIADHLRSGSFLIADGVIPSNEGRGYVLRRILRRAIRYGKKLGQNQPFIYQLVPALTRSLGGVYPELTTQQKHIETLLREEEAKFHETLHRGMGILDDAIAKTKTTGAKKIDGETVFRLYDTFGFPVDLIQVIATEHSLQVDEKDFDVRMEAQRSRSVWQGGSKGVKAQLESLVVTTGEFKTVFTGYEKLESDAKVVQLYDENGKPLSSLSGGQNGLAIFDTTPFYAESGGQIGDCGTILWQGGNASVGDTFKIHNSFVHAVHVTEGKLECNPGPGTGTKVHLVVDTDRRKMTAIHHTATHLLHAALRSVLGERVKQAGSLVDPDKLRFDFTYPKGLSDDEIRKVESIVNEEIRRDDTVTVASMNYDEAIRAGALAFFDEKYGDTVRVLRIGNDKTAFSVELCGGTHALGHTSDIQLFKILSESSVSSGVRRIEAVAGGRALGWLGERAQWWESLERKLALRGEAALTKVESLVAELKSLQKENEKLQLKAAQGGGAASGGENALWSKAKQVGALKVVAEQVPGLNAKVLRSAVDQVRDKLREKTIVVLATESEGKVAMCVGLTKDLLGTWDASKLIQPLAKEVGGTGGGKPDFAQAGGSNVAAIGPALANFVASLEGKSD